MSAPPSSLHIRTVGVIGAGLSGIVAATHLLRAGIDVTVFERSNSPGGAWKFTPEADRDPPFPSIRPPAADWDELEEWRAGEPGFDDAVRIFDPPNPVYANMKSRGSEEIMRTSLEGWPEGKRAPLDHTEVVAYRWCPQLRRNSLRPRDDLSPAKRSP
ncbi:hypothetical protein F5883DRAFT_651301 [Diaporthe sp. PMI_573]|nr:hypothetical protein F5883DRAFT_651301 [Diaporthaceae sp. PMI_573]